jgi:hypothetical protein
MHSGAHSNSTLRLSSHGAVSALRRIAKGPGVHQDGADGEYMRMCCTLRNCVITLQHCVVFNITGRPDPETSARITRTDESVAYYRTTMDCFAS